MLFETHAHYDDPRYDGDRKELLASFPQEGVGMVVTVGADMPSSRAAVKLAGEYDFVYSTVGVHPHEVKNMTDEDLLTLEAWTKNPRVVAIGEIGLDYFYEYSEKETQRYWFKEQLSLCKRLALPVIIHSREACAETLEIMENSGLNRGVIHCFSGSVETARRYIEMGFYIGIGGMVTFPKAKRIKEVAEAIPLESIVLETDCPYLAPEPHRGQRNDSRYLKYIAEKIGEIKQVDINEVEEVTWRNGAELFGI